MIYRKYSDFLIYSLLESIMVSGPVFKEILEELPSDNSPVSKICDILYNIIDNKTDIKTNYNAIEVSPETNSDILFIPDTQYQRFVSKGDDISQKTKSKISIGRMIGQILRDNGHTQFVDKDIEAFVNAYKAKWNRKYGKVSRKIEIVKSDLILKWYDEANYNSDKSTLGNSCMRYSHKRNFMRLYSENPDKVSLVIITEDDKLVARALLWKVDYCENSSVKWFLDRIYVEKDSEFESLYSWVLENVVKNDKSQLLSWLKNDDDEIRINLSKVQFDEYPYCDSLFYLYIELDEKGKALSNGFLSNRFDSEVWMSQFNNCAVFVLRETNGVKEALTHHYSKRADVYIPKDDAIYIRKISDYMPKSELKKCNYYSQWYLPEDVIWSEAQNDWIPKERAKETKWGWVSIDCIKSVATRLITDEIEPIRLAKLFGKDYLNKFFDVEETLVIPDGEIEDKYALPTHSFGDPTVSLFSKDLVVRTISGDDELEALCYPIFLCKNPNKVSELIESNPIIKPAILGRGLAMYVTKAEAQLFDLEIDEKPKWVYYQKLLNLSRVVDYDNYMLLVKNSDLDPKVKEEIKDFRTLIHLELLDTNPNYSIQYNLSKISPSLVDLYTKFVNKMFDNFISKYKEEALKNFEEYIRYYDFAPEEKVTVAQKCEKLLELYKYFMAFLWLYDDSYDAADSILKCINDNPNLIEKYYLNYYRDNNGQPLDPFSILHKLLRGTHSDYFIYRYRDISNLALSQVSQSLVPPSDLKSYIRSNLDWNDAKEVILDMMLSSK